MSKSARLIVTICILAGAGGAAMVLLRPPDAGLETISLRPPTVEAPAMCPWRDPKRDMAALFPGAKQYHKEVVSLAALRPQILTRLGPGGRIESHSLYVHRVLRDSNVVGSVMVQRVAGPHGAIEVVLAVDPSRRIVGVRLQRHREPAEVLSQINDRRLAWYRGKSVNDLTLADSRMIAVSARETADAIHSAVRTMMIEYDLGDRLSAPASGVHEH